MDLKADHGPKLANSGEDVFSGTLLAYAGIFVAVLQARFAEAGLPWRWYANYEVNDTQAATVEAPAPIYIGSVYAEEPSTRDVLPRIEVSMPGAELQKFVVGNRANIRQQDRTELFIALDNIEARIKCFGGTAGEAGVIADISRIQVVATMNIVREIFNIHEISLPSISEPTEQQEAAGKPASFVSTLSFRIQSKVQWATKPDVPLLQEIAMDIKQGGTLLRSFALRKFTR